MGPQGHFPAHICRNEVQVSTVQVSRDLQVLLNGRDWSSQGTAASKNLGLFCHHK